MEAFVADKASAQINREHCHANSSVIQRWQNFQPPSPFVPCSLTLMRDLLLANRAHCIGLRTEEKFLNAILEGTVWVIVLPAAGTLKGDLLFNEMAWARHGQCLVTRSYYCAVPFSEQTHFGYVSWLPKLGMLIGLQSNLMESCESPQSSYGTGEIRNQVDRIWDAFLVRAGA